MADKYVDTTLLTGLDDGTSIANAWKDLRKVLLDTSASGSYAAGDTIHIRSHDGVSDITVSLGGTALLQAAKGTSSAPVYWKVDDGTKWPQGGTLKIQHSGDTAQFRFSQYNHWESDAKYNLHFEGNSTTHCRCWIIAGSNTFVNVDFNRTVPAADKVDMMVFTNEGGTTIGVKPSHIRMIGCRLLSRENRAAFAGSFPHIGIFGYSIHMEFVDCDFDLTNHNANEAYIQGISSITGGNTSTTVGSCRLRIRGGKITAPDPSITFIHYLSASSPESFRTGLHASIIGLESGTQPITYTHEGTGGLTIRSDNGLFITQGLNGKQHVRAERLSGITEWDPTGNFPVLLSQLPDNLNTKWSLKVFPDRCGQSHPYGIIDTSKFYNVQTPATKTVTVELAIKDTNGVGGSGAFDSPQGNEWWMELTYVDNATGQYVVETTEAAGALTASTAAWLPLSAGKVTFGSNNYSRYKLEITTANSIKPDTMIYIEVFSTKPAIDADDFYFVDPDPSIA